jgi:hypothetical protein
MYSDFEIVKNVITDSIEWAKNQDRECLME